MKNEETIFKFSHESRLFLTDHIWLLLIVFGSSTSGHILSQKYIYLGDE